MEPRQAYSTDLSDKEWELIKHLVPEAKPGGRPEKYPKREILNGIFSIVRGGCAWRLMPHDLPPWQIVYQYRGSPSPNRSEELKGAVTSVTIPTLTYLGDDPRGITFVPTRDIGISFF